MDGYDQYLETANKGMERVGHVLIWIFCMPVVLVAMTICTVIAFPFWIIGNVRLDRRER